MKKPKGKFRKERGDEIHEAVEKKGSKYLLKLYVTATTPSSIRAVANVRMLCEEYLPGQFKLEVIDISKQPEIAQSEQVIGAPTLIKLLPLPIRRFIGDMSNTERLIVGLNLTAV